MSPVQLSRLELLPVELKEKILGMLLPQDIKSMRLLTRQMHDLSSPYLMKRVYFALREQTIKIFNLIIEHPIFSTTVEEIVFDCSLFGCQHYACTCPKGRSRCVCSRNKCIENCTTYAGVANLLGNGTSEHQYLHDTQERIAKTGFDIKSLEKAGVAFRNLRSLVISDWQTIDATFPPPATCKTWFHPARPRTRVPYTNKALDSSAWYIQKGPMKWDVTDACFPETIDNMAKTKQKCIDVTQNWCGVFRNGNSSIWNLEAKLLTWAPSPIGKAIPLSMVVPKLAPDSLVMRENDRQFAESLHYFNTFFQMELNHIMNGPQGQLRMFQTLLASMQTLERLDLANSFALIRYAGGAEHICDRMFFIKDIYWPRLRRLTLSGTWYVQASSLVEFFRRHGSILYQIRLCGINLEETKDETWVDVAEKMHTCLPSLRKCMLRNLSEFGRESLHLTYLSVDGHSTRPRSDCAYRLRHLKTLEQLISGQLSSGSGAPMVELERLREVRMNWHNYNAMDRGPRTEKEFRLRQQRESAEGIESPGMIAGSGTVS